MQALAGRSRCQAHAAALPTLLRPRALPFALASRVTWHPIGCGPATLTSSALSAPQSAAPGAFRGPRTKWVPRRGRRTATSSLRHCRRRPTPRCTRGRRRCPARAAGSAAARWSCRLRGFSAARCQRPRSCFWSQKCSSSIDITIYSCFRHTAVTQHTHTRISGPTLPPSVSVRLLRLRPFFSLATQPTGPAATSLAQARGLSPFSPSTP